MKPKNRHFLRLCKFGQRFGHSPRWLLVNMSGNLRAYKTYKRARQAMANVVWIAWNE